METVKTERPTIYRMPYGFGPSEGPRQGPDGRNFNGEWSRCTTLAITARSDRESIEALLPPGFVASEDATVKVQTHFNTDFAWLAGRGYNFTEVLFSAIYEGEVDRVEGDFVAVMWESMPEPVLPGREEIGLPKLFAEIPWFESAAGRTTMQADWDGFRFFDATLDGLDLGPWPDALEAEAEIVKLGLGGGAGRHRLYYKYIPATGAWGEADAAYATASPPGNYEMKMIESWSGLGSFEFHQARWEDIPTFSNVVNKLADLPIYEFTGASMGRVLIGFNDLREGQMVLR